MNRSNKALDTARKAFGSKKHVKQLNENHQDALVPDQVKSDEKKHSGRKVTPKCSTSVTDDMKRPEKDSYNYNRYEKGPTAPIKGGALGDSHGKYAINRNAFVSYANTTRFDMDPAIVRAFGASARTAYDKYGNVDFDYTQQLPARMQQEAVQYFHALKQQANRSNTSKRVVFERWMQTNEIQYPVLVETARLLGMGVL